MNITPFFGKYVRQTAVFFQINVVSEKRLYAQFSETPKQGTITMNDSLLELKKRLNEIHLSMNAKNFSQVRFNF